ncbi:Pol polyprotein, partial [Rasamsonia emersonii CBS 393.64]
NGRIIIIIILRDAKLRLKLKKCEFHVQETDFLGHRITTEGIQTDKNKVQAILEWPKPTNVKELQSFIGLINNYRQYIEGYAKVMKPLFDLLRKDKSYEWTSEQQQAFEEAKRRITTAPILAQHDPEKPTTIEIDASDYAIGA